MSVPDEEPSQIRMAGAAAPTGGSDEIDSDASIEDDVEAEDLPPRPEAADSRDLLQLEIDVREDPFSIHQLVRMIDSKRLVLTPPFQRREVWDLTRRSQFLESVLLNYPLPPLYLNQRKDGTYLVVDGLQRTSSIYRFIKGEYALQDLLTLQWMNGLHYSELESLAQARIEDRKLMCYVLKPSVPFGVVHDIFARINRGGMPLNRQELRHAFYQGPATALLEDLVQQQPFAEWVRWSLNWRRMGDDEAALRCIAFARIDPDRAYRGNLDLFLNDTLRQLNDAQAAAERAALPSKFARVFSQIHRCLGGNAFRIPTERTRGRLNLAIMESVYRFFAENPLLGDGDPPEHQRYRLKENYQALLQHDEYRDLVSRATSSTRRLRERFRLAHEILEIGRER